MEVPWDEAGRFGLMVTDDNATVLRIEHLHICLPQGRNRSNVLPITCEAVSIHIALVTQQIRDNIFTEIILRIRSRS